MGIILNITRNNKNYKIPICACMINPDVYSSTVIYADKQDFIQMSDMHSIYELLELPNTLTSQITESWTINGVTVNVNIKQESSSQYNIMVATINPGNNQWVIYGKYKDFESGISKNTLYLSYSGNCPAYDYNSKNWIEISGLQGFTGNQFSSDKNYFETINAKYSNYFDIGIDPITIKTPNLNVVYSVTAFSKRIKFDNASSNNYYLLARLWGDDNQEHFGKFMKWLTTRPSYIPIVIPSYPNQNPDEDDDNSGQTPSDPPIPGDGDTSSDPIPNPPAKPTFDVTNTGFVVVYNPSVTEIRQLAYFMWSGDFTDLIKKMFASPFEAIISLKMLFCPITAGSSQTVWLGNVETDVSMAKITDQFTDVDLGTINVNEFFGSFADYAPFTKIQIYLPFIGFKDLNVDEVMNSQLHLRYRVDVYTGACIAYLTVTKTIKSTNLNSILYQFDGNCAMEIPFTSNDNSRYVAAIMNSVASSALSLANTSGYTMPVAGKGFNQKAIPSTFELGSLAPVANGMLDIMSAKPNVQRAGSLSGAVSAMALKQPYLIIHRPIAQMPADYQKYLGIPLNLTRQLANVTGYTIVSQVFMSSELATDREIAMITEALKNGVIL